MGAVRNVEVISEPILDACVPRVLGYLPDENEARLMKARSYQLPELIRGGYLLWSALQSQSLRVGIVGNPMRTRLEKLQNWR